MRAFAGFCVLTLILLLTASCALGGNTEPAEAPSPSEADPPELITTGMEPEEAAVAFVDAWLRSAYLGEEDAFTPYTAEAMAEFDPAGDAVMNGEPVTYEALEKNARYWQEKAKWFRYTQEAQEIYREDYSAPCITSVKESGEDWANITVSGMMSFTYADSEESSGMEFVFDLNMVRTDHRTSYAWIVGDAVQPFDSFDAEHKGDPAFSADSLIAEFSLNGSSYASGADSPKEWKLTDVLSESITNRNHNRSVRIMELETASAHTAEINAVIRDEFKTIYDRYMRGTQQPYDTWRLVIDTEAWEQDRILCIAVIADQPSTKLVPLTVRNIFLDLVTDELLTLEQYARRTGIDPDAAAAEISSHFGPESMLTGCACSGVFREEGKIVYAIQLTYNEDGNTVEETMLVVPGEERTQGRFSGFAVEP